MKTPGDKVIVHLPLALREFADGQARIAVTGATVRDVLDALATDYPLAGARILGPEGELRRYVNVFLGEANVRDIQGLDSRLEPGDELFIIPAVAGG